MTTPWIICAMLYVSGLALVGTTLFRERTDDCHPVWCFLVTLLWPLLIPLVIGILLWAARESEQR